MIQPATFKFLVLLKKNNDKAWFDAHRKDYESAKTDFELFVTDLLKELVPIEPELANYSAKDCIYRIFRDVRFSKDKTPYKPHFSTVFARGGRKFEGAGYYLHLEPGAIFAGGGIWMPQPPMLKAVRQEIDYGFSDFQEILNEKSFKKMFDKIDGEKLQKPPQGYDVSNPAVEFLKMKSFTTGHKMQDKDFTTNAAAKNVATVFKTLSPFINFLNRAVQN